MNINYELILNTFYMVTFIYHIQANISYVNGPKRLQFNIWIWSILMGQR